MWFTFDQTHKVQLRQSYVYVFQEEVFVMDIHLSSLTHSRSYSDLVLEASSPWSDTFLTAGLNLNPKKIFSVLARFHFLPRTSRCQPGFFQKN